MSVHLRGDVGLLKCGVQWSRVACINQSRLRVFNLTGCGDGVRQNWAVPTIQLVCKKVQDSITQKTETYTVNIMLGTQVVNFYPRYVPEVFAEVVATCGSSEGEWSADVVQAHIENAYKPIISKCSGLTSYWSPNPFKRPRFSSGFNSCRPLVDFLDKSVI